MYAFNSCEKKCWKQNTAQIITVKKIIKHKLIKIKINHGRKKLAEFPMGLLVAEINQVETFTAEISPSKWNDTRFLQLLVKLAA